MRWFHRLLFLLAIVAPTGLARSGLCGVTFHEADEYDAVLLQDTLAALPAVVFDDRSLLRFEAMTESNDDLFDQDAVSDLGTGDPNAALQLLPMEHYLTPIAPPVTVRSAHVMTVAVPLPPAAVGGAVAVATLLGGPLLSGRRLRRKPARTFR